MATRKKSSAKADDTLVDIVEVKEQAEDFFERYRFVILGAVGALVLAVGGFFAYTNFYKIPKQQEAVEQMYQAQIQFERDSFTQALTNPGGGYQGFLDISENYKGTDAANLALYYAGISYLNLGQYDAAIDYLKSYKPAGDVIPAMKFGALGDAYSEKNDFGQAMSYYKKAASTGVNEAITPYYLKKIGMLHERNSEWDQAIKVYQEIKDKYPTSPDGRDIDKYLIRAEAKKG
ncbi:MAG: tetratricopeptide repeat protein [Saprospiraceae bacterium]|jgi:tetratricopeptide (TPR) repeat protein|nr:tetratricopeptide repeat protein [Saprospiraceae bacterium]